MEHASKPSYPFDARPAVLASRLAMERAARGVHWEFEQGLNSLATMACVAPLAGVFGTVSMILFDTFRGMGTDKATGMAMIAYGLSCAVAPAALGLFVGLEAHWYFRYLRHRLAGIDREMENESLLVVNLLSRYSGGVAAEIPAGDGPAAFFDRHSMEADKERRAWRRAVVGAVGVSGLAWGVALFRAFGVERLPVEAAVLTSGRGVLTAFCCAYLPAYAVWVELLHRKRAGVPLVAAILGLAWCAGGVLLPLFGL